MEDSFCDESFEVLLLGMAKTRLQKEEIIQALKKRLEGATSVIVAHYSAMTVSQSQELRRLLEGEQAELMAIKKTLLDVTLEEKPEWGVNARGLDGSIALVIGHGDEVAPAKILATFRKKNEVIEAIGGVFQQHWITKEEVKTLSTLPTKQQLRGQLVGVLNAPASGLVGAMNGVLRQLVGTIDAVGKAKV